jgi:branched-chain amino acid transport system substrate-binding protein
VRPAGCRQSDDKFKSDGGNFNESHSSCDRHPVAAVALTTASVAQTPDTPGVAATEIKLGQTVPLSGPVSAYATFSRASLAYFAMVNDRGDINGRKVTLISIDDGFSPPKAVEQTRRLVESDGVFAIFAPVGSAPSAATQKYLNTQKVPQMLIQSGLARWNNPKEFPWSISGLPNYEVQAATYGKYILDHMPQARVAVLYQSDDFGVGYLSGLKAGLGSRADQMVVSTQSFQLTDPTVDSQTLTLAASKADVLLIAATTRQTVQTLKKMGEINWHPQLFVSFVAASPERTYSLAGNENAKGAISMTVFKDPADPELANDPDMKAYVAFMEKYYPAGDKNEGLNVAAYVEGEILSELLKRCGADLTRETLLKQASNFSGATIPMISKGVVLQTEPDNYNLFRRPQLIRFDGKLNRAIANPTGG